MERAFWLDPCDKPALLMAMMRELADNARIMLEGDLSACDFAAIPGRVEGVVEPFRREYEGEAVVLPISEQTITTIKAQLLPYGRIVRDVGAIQIEQNGELQFVAADQFHRECVSVGHAVRESVLQELVTVGILRAYKTHAAAMQQARERFGR
jgi:hypothetical protein